MQEGKHVSNGEFYGEAMGARAMERHFCLVPAADKQKNQQLHFCKLLIFRMEDGVVCAIEQIEAN